jgi:hypothetical protein
MKKLILSTFGIFLVVIMAKGQTFGELTWQKKKIPALITEVPQSAATTLSAISNKLAQKGYKPVSQRGALQYRGVQLPEIGLENYDLVIKVDKKGSKRNESSVVHFAISRGNDNYITTTDDPALVERIRSFGAYFPIWASEQSLEEDILKQENTLKAAEKRLSDLEKESAALEKRKAKLEEEIQVNKRNIERQRIEVDNQRKALDTLRAKRMN